jgi:hypothetical protein
VSLFVLLCFTVNSCLPVDPPRTNPSILCRADHHSL